MTNITSPCSDLKTGEVPQTEYLFMDFKRLKDLWGNGNEIRSKVERKRETKIKKYNKNEETTLNPKIPLLPDHKLPYVVKVLLYDI